MRWWRSEREREGGVVVEEQTNKGKIMEGGLRDMEYMRERERERKREREREI